MRIAAMARVALTSARRLFRYQSLRIDLPKGTAGLFAIPASRAWIFMKRAFGRRAGEMEPNPFSRSVSARGAGP